MMIFRPTRRYEVQTRGRVLRSYAALIERRDEVLLARLVSGSSSLKPALTLSKLLALTFALVIHALTILMLVVGLQIIVSKFAGVFSICYGGLLIGIALAVTPRFHKKPEEIALRSKFPTLYQFVDDVADALTASHVDALVINEYPNASFGRYGIRQSKIVILGYPLWMQLDDQERVALIAHELAHNVNRDFSRTFFVGSALDSLVDWFNLLYPNCIFCRGVFEAPVRLAMWLLSHLLFIVIVVLHQLLLGECRRAEYLADYLAASLSGTDAMLSMLRKFEGRDLSAPVLFQSTHPPIAHRLELLAARDSMPPRFVVSPGTSSQMQKELSVLHRELTKRMEWRRSEGVHY